MSAPLGLAALGVPSKEEQELYVLAKIGKDEAKKILTDLDTYLHDELRRDGSFWDFFHSCRTFPAMCRAAGKQHSRARLSAAVTACVGARHALKHFDENKIHMGWLTLLRAQEEMGRFRPVDPKKAMAEAVRFMQSQRSDRREEADSKRIVLEHWHQHQSSYLFRGSPSKNKCAEAIAKNGPSQLVPFPFVTVREWLKSA